MRRSKPYWIKIFLDPTNFPERSHDLNDGFLKICGRSPEHRSKGIENKTDGVIDYVPWFVRLCWHRHFLEFLPCSFQGLPEWNEILPQTMDIRRKESALKRTNTLQRPCQSQANGIELFIHQIEVVSQNIPPCCSSTGSVPMIPCCSSSSISSCDSPSNSPNTYWLSSPKQGAGFLI